MFLTVSVERVLVVGFREDGGFSLVGFAKLKKNQVLFRQGIVVGGGPVFEPVAVALASALSLRRSLLSLMKMVDGEVLVSGRGLAPVAKSSHWKDISIFMVVIGHTGSGAQFCEARGREWFAKI